MQKSNKLIPVLAGVILTIAILTSVLIVLNRGEDSVANEPTVEGNAPTEPAQSSSTSEIDCSVEYVSNHNGRCSDGTPLDYTSYHGADLSYTGFSHANLRGSNFNTADLSAGHFVDSNFQSAIFKNADFRKASLQGVIVDALGDFIYENCVISSFDNPDLRIKDALAWTLTCDGEVFTWQRQ